MGRTVSLSNLEAWDCIQNLTFPKGQWTTLKFIEKQSEMMLSYQQCLITHIYILPGPTVTNFPQVNILPQLWFLTSNLFMHFSSEDLSWGMCWGIWQFWWRRSQIQDTILLWNDKQSWTRLSTRIIEIRPAVTQLLHHLTLKLNFTPLNHHLNSLVVRKVHVFEVFEDKAQTWGWVRINLRKIGDGGTNLHI